LTYGNLLRQVDAVASCFLVGGLAVGDRVAVFLDNSEEAVVSILSTLEAGGCIIAINPATQAERLRRILDNCKPRFVVTTADRLPMVQAVLGVDAEPPEILVVGSASQSHR
jgi:acyl-CoA synthetase (AMP-forming)/AMP-acid ligase II